MNEQVDPLTPIAELWLRAVQSDPRVHTFAQRAALAVAHAVDEDGHLDAVNAGVWAERMTQASGVLTSWRTAKSSMTRLRRDGYLEALAYSPMGTEQRLRLPEAASDTQRATRAA